MFSIYIVIYLLGNVSFNGQVNITLDFLFSQSCSPSALQARLKVAAHEAEEESDTIAEDFLEGKTEIDDFLSSFMEKRTVCNIQIVQDMYNTQ